MPADFSSSYSRIEAARTWPVDVFESDNGAEQRRLRGQYERVGWKITTPPMLQSAYDTLRGFFQTKYGSYTAFTWDCPEDGVTYTVRFSGTLEDTQTPPRLHICSYTLIRVL